MTEKLVVDEDANASSSQQSYFTISGKKVIVEGDIVTGYSALSNMQQSFFMIDSKKVALPGDSDGTNSLTSSGSNDYFYVAIDQQPTNFTEEPETTVFAL
jgi:hypothetical protein